MPASYQLPDHTAAQLQELDPNLALVFSAFQDPPESEGCLDRKTQCLVLVAIACCPTRVHPEVVREAVFSALAAGAQDAELLECIALSAIVATHGLTVGLPVLRTEMRRRGLDIPTRTDATAQRMRDKLAGERYWQRFSVQFAEFLDAMVDFSPDLMARFLSFGEYPWQGGAIPPKVKELIYVALDSLPEHLYRPGLSLHIGFALDFGASPAEILETIHLAGSVGRQSMICGVAALRDSQRAEG